MLLPEARDWLVRPVIRTFIDLVQPVNDLDFHPQSPAIISGSKDGSIKFFDFSKAVAKNPSDYSGYLQFCYLLANVPEIGGNGAINQVEYASTGGTYVIASIDGAIRVWDGVTAQCVWSVIGAHGSAEATSACFTRDQRCVLSCGNDSTVHSFMLKGNYPDEIATIISEKSENGGLSAWDWELATAHEWLEVLNPTEFFQDIVNEHEYVECTASTIQALAVFIKLYPGLQKKEIETFIAKVLLLDSIKDQYPNLTEEERQASELPKGNLGQQFCHPGESQNSYANEDMTSVKSSEASMEDYRDAMIEVIEQQLNTTAKGNAKAKSIDTSSAAIFTLG
ncbi:hypothetical protein GIB67_007440 [Kingdonia uniflora]|uniref:Cleavage stimulation factor 50 kDa subunit n=1 Tax=Kingdonia uniflora TaxID=39325 RepID=A0A7J7P3P0_9MAGN|nr:hypothetical protein GIB67_007440 [Kingdonia uniflora]